MVKTNITENISNIYNGTENSTKTTIYKLYGDIGKKYFDKYGGSVIVTIVTILLIIGLISYINIKKNIIEIKENWNKLKCDPRYAPFAGIIVPEKGKSFIDIGTENANYCFNTVLKEVSNDALMPYNSILNVFNELVKNITDSTNKIRNLANNMREKLRSMYEEKYNRIMNTVVGIQKMIINIKDIMSKMKSSMVTSMYPMLGMYYILKSSIKVMYGIIIKILIGLVATIVILWIFPFTWGAAAAMTSIFMLIMVPTVILASMMGEIFHLSPGKLPKKPKHRRHCFNGDYKIVTKRGIVSISNLIPGDHIGSTQVTSVMRLNSEGETMYDFGNGLYVSGNHKVYNDKYNNFIDVSEDGRFKSVDNFNDKYIYCFNTTNKIIRLENNLFLDYDELTNTELTKLIKEYKALFPTYEFKTSNIHSVFGGGLHPNTRLKLKDGTYKNISNIDIGDILEDNSIVEGKIMIDNKIGVFNIIIDGTMITGCNPNIVYKTNNTKKSTIYLNKKQRKNVFFPFNYHITTNTGYFKYLNIELCDYNSCIDYFIEKPEEIVEVSYF